MFIAGSIRCSHRQRLLKMYKSKRNYHYNLSCVCVLNTIEYTEPNKTHTTTKTTTATKIEKRNTIS